MKNIFITIAYLLTAILFTLTACEDNPVETDNELPGRRDYTWTVDTLKVSEGRAIPSWIWGASANDIWAVGQSFANAYCIWHYDGNNWSNYQPDEYIDPVGICGFSSNNIWTSSLGTASIPTSFWHYNGIAWNKHSEIIIPGYYHITIQSIAGNSPGNIYAVGFADSINGQSYKGIIFHFDGNKWNEVNIPVIENSFDQISYDKKSGHFLITGWIFNEPNKYLYRFDGRNLIEFFTTQDGLALNNINSSVYPSTLNGKLYKYYNGDMILFKDFANTDFVGAAKGRTEMDFFTINWDGVGHYNGTDLITIYNKWNNDWFPDGGMVFEKDVFFIWDDSYNTFIVHGKLN